ncbi:MAG: S53 family peptidase [Acidobacteriaceae bacterium]
MKSSCMKIWFSSTLAAIVFVCLSAFAQTGQQLLPTHHVPHAVLNREAKLVAAVPGTQLMHVDIMLPLCNQDKLAELLRQLYDSSSPNYRQFLSVAQFTQQFGPTPDDYQTVVAWAQAKGFTVGDQPANLLLMPITGTVAQINAAFNVSMQVYQHPTESRTFYSPDREPTVDLKVPLWHIVGMNNYSIPHPLVNRARQGQAVVNVSGSGPGGSSYLPGDMRAAYYGGTTLTGSGQAVGLVEFDGYNISDVTGTFDGAATATTNGSNYILTYTTGGVHYSIPINNVLLDGASSAPSTTIPAYQDAAGEVVLDIAQPIGMAPGLSQVLVYIAPYSTLPIYGATGDTDIFERMATDNIAKQLSCSWNWSPADYHTNDAIFLQMESQGQNFFAASGDYGSWPNGAYYYPEEDPNVTSVGGTSLTTNGSGGSWVSETAWPSSAGGISPDDLPIGSYQQLAGFTCTGCSTAYRNAPDVAMEADSDNYVCALGSCSATWNGTSFAAPRWAGFLALGNQQAVANGNAPMGGIGFMNDAVYPIGLGSSYESDFHDITSGSNGAYSAVTGYDLVTGWGSPDGASLINALAAPPPAPGNYTPVSNNFSLTLQARQTNPNTSTNASNYGGGFATVIANSATLYVTVSGTVNTANGNGTIELYYSKDNGAHWLLYTEWSATFGPTVEAIPITGITNLDSVYVQLQAQANWTAPPLLYPGCTATASNIHAITN